MSNTLSNAQFGPPLAFEHRVNDNGDSTEPMFDQSRTEYGIADPTPHPTDVWGGHRGIIVNMRSPRTKFDLQPQEWATPIKHEDRKSTVRSGFEQNGQGTLFGYEHRKPSVDFMMANEEFRHYVPHLLGHVAQESMSRFGETPIADEDLSRHSSRMVTRLADAGLIERPENWEEQRNTLTFPSDGDGAVHTIPDETQRTAITPDRLEAGKRLVMEGLRKQRAAKAPRKSKPSDEDNNQPSLFHPGE